MEQIKEQIINELDSARVVLDIDRAILECPDKINCKVLADKIGRSNQVISNWKKNAPSIIKDILKISEITGLSIDKLIRVIK